MILVCADGETLFVETTDPAALAPDQRLRRRIAGSCPANPASFYASELAESALRLLPACAGLEPRGLGNAPTVLRDCATLAGDRMAAAAVRNRLDDLRWAQTPDRIAGLFAADVVFDSNGERIPARDAATAWQAGGGHFYPRRLVGETGRRVRVEGVLTRVTRSGDGPEVHWEAPVTLAVAYPPSQRWQIVEVRVSAFTVVQWPLYPRRPPAASRR